MRDGVGLWTSGPYTPLMRLTVMLVAERDDVVWMIWSAIGKRNDVMALDTIL